MAFNGSGTFVRVHDWTTDLGNAVPVTASRMDAEDDGIATGLSSCLVKDGQQTATARIPFALGASSMAGSVSSTSYGQINDLNTGLYFPAAGQWGLSADGTGTLTSTATKITTGVAIDFGGAAAPTSSDGAALGSATQMWSDLFLASGAVINFNNGDVTATHSANTLAFAGASSGYTFDAAGTFGGLLTVSTGGAAITGNSTVTGTLTASSTLTASNGFTVTTGTVSLPAKSVAVTALANGTIVDRAYAEVTDFSSTSAEIPADDSIPTVSEGTELMTLQITTNSATNRVRLRLSGMWSSTSTREAVITLFHGSTCIGVDYHTFHNDNEVADFVIAVEHVPGSAAAQDYSVRYGISVEGAAGTVYINGKPDGRKFGGAARAVLTADEIQAS